MADIAGLWNATAGNPDWQYSVGYSQTDRNGSSATYHVTIAFRMTNSGASFGYGITANVNINGANYDIRVKNPSPSWSGTGWQVTYAWDIACSAGSGGGTSPITITIWGTEGASSPNLTFSGTCSLSTWNTAPSMLGLLTISPASGSIVGENTATINLSGWGANDNESSVYYTIQKDTDDAGSWPTIADNVVIGTVSYNDSIASLAQGSKVRYAISCVDTSGVRSGYLFSGYVTKNKFTKATLTSVDSFLYGDTAIAFTIAGALNTNGNTTMTYSLACAGLTTKTATAGAYSYTVTFAEIKALIGSSVNYQGNLVFTLTTANAYGSSGTSQFTIAVDLRTSPRVLTAGITVPNTGVNVPANGAYLVAGSWYFVPNRKKIEVNWGRSVDELGGAITYDVYVSVAGGAYSLVVANLPDVATMTYSFNLSAPAIASTCTVKITAKTSYGTTRDTLALGANIITIHYYNPSTITFDPVNRLQLSATVTGKVQLNTSITTGLTISVPTFNFTGYVNTATTWTVGTKSFSGALVLTATQTGSFSLTVKDTASIAIDGGTGTLSTILAQAVSAYIPMIATRSTGIGINALPLAGHILTVGGNLDVSGDAGSVTATSTGITQASQLKSVVAIGTAPLIVTSTTKVTNLNVDLLDGLQSGNASGNIPISNGTVNTNLNAEMVGGVKTTIGAASPVWPFIVQVKVDGVMEVGKYIDFHNTSNDGIDAPLRLTSELGNLFLNNNTNGASQVHSRTWTGNISRACNSYGIQSINCGFKPIFVEMWGGSNTDRTLYSHGATDGVTTGDTQTWGSTGGPNANFSQAGQLISLHTGSQLFYCNITYTATGFDLNWQYQGGSIPAGTCFFTAIAHG